MLSRIWKQHLAEFIPIDDGNENLNYFYVALNSNLPTRDSITNITEDKYDVVACMDGGKKVQLIHRILNLEGTRSQSKYKILVIIGM